MNFEHIKDKLIVGILSTSQQVKYGKTSNGKPIYQIKPLDNKLPNFWITYAGTLKGKIIIVFKFKSYKEGTLPFGKIYNIIGLATNDNLAKALMYHYNINRKVFKSDIKLNCNENKITRKDLTHLNIFSIDPDGCIDIDDALSIEKNEDETYFIGVHIAQPICFLTKEEIQNRCNLAFSTLYYETNDELWSKEVVEKSSLLVNKIKPAYSIIFTIKNNVIIKTESFPSTIINKLNTSYEKTDYKQIKLLNNISNLLFNKTLDSHELVSQWMVLANTYIGQTFKNIPFRVQSSKEIENKELNDEIKEIFMNYQKESAEYSYDKDYHSSLDINKYTHFTSPIRRIIDTIIHYTITYNDTIDFDINKINYLDKQTKKFHKQMKLNEIINKITDFETTGYIYEKKGNKWIVYFKELGFMKVKIVDDKLSYLVDYSKYTDNEYKFMIYKKSGFLPKEKILIVPKFDLISLS